MKIVVEFLVVKLNEEVVDITPIQDIYEECSIGLKSENLSDEDIFKYYSHMSREFQESKLKEIRKSGRLYEECEAKDLTCELSQYEILIAEKEVEIN